jgi:hypothetical protein
MESTNQAPASGGGGSNGLLWGCGIIGCLGLILILVIGGGFGVWTYLKTKSPEVTAIATDDTEPGATSNIPSGTPATVPTGGVTKVVLSWTADVDMDLEIWDRGGENLKHRAFNLCGTDIKKGSDGPEWFEFKSYPDVDYSTGEFLVSAFFAGRENNSITSAAIKLTVTRPNGSTVERTKTIQWDPGKDQWHAFRINAATGQITDVDRFIRIQSRPNSN